MDEEMDFVIFEDDFLIGESYKDQLTKALHLGDENRLVSQGEGNNPGQTIATKVVNRVLESKTSMITDENTP